ncbi:FAD-dependent oxidoreductase [Aurantiacibacter gangjinensis]|uniref:Uncharacterized protein n=1 Tax=Aurantiacibacter gangjinensis TaxID=502682 RepID=A0A0G9MLB6_9SPHN|nr:NAD(P)/FAD-dependent oxidoreductase [Aurantiacibacter gangjinensis]APE27416.1 Putative n-hydroxybenzoate hydroxylase [Aurantiacibacter gangjinensis]KLE31490.1 hypothetical protein AAW01_07905 [Aurantiacibacter gangjinensis]
MDRADNFPKKIRIGIIGAGPAGLTTALAIEYYDRKKRFEVTLFERNSSPTDYPGVEYGIQERACRAFERIGIREKALHRSLRARKITFYNSRLEKKFRPIELDGDWTRHVVRQEFVADLVGLVKRAKLLTNHEIVSVRPNEDRSVTLKANIGEGRNEEFTFDAVLSCDGSSSTTRSQLFPMQDEKRDQGFSCIYMMLEAEKPLEAEERYLAMTNAGVSNLIMGEEATLTTFPLGKGRAAYGIGFDHQSRGHLWSRFDLDPDTEWADIPANTREALARRLVEDACAHDPFYAEMLKHVQDWMSPRVYLWAMEDTDPLHPPYGETGNVLAIGDAAHVLLPTIGMGASTAIEDGEMLGRFLVEGSAGVPGPEVFRQQFADSVAKPYAAERTEVWDDLVRRARTAAEINFTDQHERKRFAVGPQIPHRTASRLVSAIEKAARAAGV